MPFIQTADRTNLFYNDWGQGRPVVLIHGWPLDSDMWEYQATDLANQGFRVITYDRRGFGRSDQPWSGYDYDMLTSDLATIMEKLDLQQTLLVGFSMGGGEVVRYLAQHAGAKRVSQAVLISAVTPLMLKTPDHEEGTPRKAFDDIVESLEKDRPAFLTGFGKKFYGVGVLSSPVSQELLDWHSMVALRASAHATRVCVRSFSETDFRADLAGIATPTLLIHGDADAIVPIAAAGRAGVKQIKGAKLIEYPGAPHGLFVTERERLLKDILAFAR